MKIATALAFLLCLTLGVRAQLTLVQTGGTFRTDDTNLAFTATVVSEGDYGGVHVAANVADGIYGNSNSWLGPANRNYGFIVLGFSSPVTIGSIAFGRDNTGVYSDRTFGVYEIQYSANYIPGEAPFSSGFGWPPLQNLDYAASPPTDPALRHLYNLNSPLTNVTGLMITVPSFLHSESFESGYEAMVIDEIEVYATAFSAVPEPSTYAAIFGACALLLAIWRRRPRAA